MLSNLICPYCKAELLKSKHRTFQCDANHSFDISKEGYLNLLPVNKKKSKSPGDNELMIAARRFFLEQGFYNPMIEKVQQIIANNLKLNGSFYALDSGCGEGYYSEKALRNENQKAIILGTDISKIAVKNAAKKYKDNFYFVSSVYDMPVVGNSMDLILSVFAPIEANEFTRILKSSGYLIVVSPAENHMKQLAELIYDSFRPHQHKIVMNMPEILEPYMAERISFEIDIKDAETLSALHKMTPYYYNTSKKAQEKVVNCKNISIQCDFHISVFKPAQL